MIPHRFASRFLAFERNRLALKLAISFSEIPDRSESQQEAGEPAPMPGVLLRPGPVADACAKTATLTGPSTSAPALQGVTREARARRVTSDE